MYLIRWKDLSKSSDVVDYLEKKLVKVTRFKIVDITNTKIEFVYYAKEKSYKTRFNIPLKKNSCIIRAEAIGTDIFTTINEAVEKVIDQLRRQKTKFEHKKNYKNVNTESFE